MAKPKSASAKSSEQSAKARRAQAQSKPRKLVKEDLAKVVGGVPGEFGPGWIEC